MRLNSTQKLMLFVSILLCGICAFLFPEEKITEAIHSTTPSISKIDTIALFQKKVILNRLSNFIFYLNQKGISIHNEYELLLLLSNPNTRQQISSRLGIDSILLLLHAELADLKQIGMSELDAQVLHFSQRNYQSPFTGTTINLSILANADAERILEDIGGWTAGNDNPKIANYQLSLEEIELWITEAKGEKWNFFAEMS
jgi:hypothetical protein